MKLRRCSGVAAWAVTLSVAVSSPVVRASPQAAHDHYVRAIELVRHGELRPAKEEFERAFAESPHPSVLYNLARVCFDLGELDEARRHAEQFLADAGPETSEQRTDIQRLLEELDRREAQSHADADEATDARNETDAMAEPRPPQTTAPASQAPTKPAVGPACPGCLHPAEVDSLVSAERGRTTGIVLGATGVALVAAGAGILIWNGGRARDAERGRQELGAEPPSGEVVDQQGLLGVLAYERAVSENRAAFRSVERFEVVGWSTLGAGAALLGAGVVLVLTQPEQPRAALSLRGGQCVLTAAF